MDKAVVVLFGLLLVFGGLALGAWLLMLLWNAVAVPLFHAPSLTFWLSFGLLMLLGFIGRALRRS